MHALVIAGGQGTRFWPLSTPSRPKQCLSLGGEASFLQQTVARISPLIPPERVWVVTGPSMADLVRAQLPQVPPPQVLVEPSPRNTLPCIAWGVARIALASDDQAVVAVLPADHHVRDPSELLDAMATAGRAAQASGALVTLGIRPSRAETGFGYLELGPPEGAGHSRPVHRVNRFCEKPDLPRARTWASAGTHLWNAGMFVFRAADLVAALPDRLPGVRTLIAAVARGEGIEALWADCEATSIDYGLMEQHPHTLVVPTAPGWSDVGSWDAVEGLLPPCAGGHGLAQAVVAVDAQDCVVHAPGLSVALVGVQGLAVVVADGQVLVADRGAAQAVRKVGPMLAEALMASD